MVKTATRGRLSIERKIWCRLSLCGCEFMIVAFCSAKEAKKDAYFLEQKATLKSRTMLSCSCKIPIHEVQYEEWPNV